MSIKQKDFTNNLFALLKEFFESPLPTGAACLDQKTGLFDTLDTLSATQVSQCVNEAPSIAAHCEHVRFYNTLLFKDLKGEAIPKVNWQETWLTQSVTPQEWETLKTALKTQYQEMMTLLESFTTWDDDKVGIPMAVLAHTAYHLGAIRQLIRFV
ncbi:MAG: hypothetical protein ACRCYY_13005 [Trueperaceae bacterium]